MQTPIRRMSRNISPDITDRHCLQPSCMQLRSGHLVMDERHTPSRHSKSEQGGKKGEYKASVRRDQRAFVLCRYLRLQSNSCGQVRGVDVASWPAKTEFRQRISPAISERAGGDSSSQATCLHAAACLRAPSGRASTVPICVGLCLRVASVDTARHSTSRLQQASADALGCKKFAMQAWHVSSTRSLLPMLNKRSSNTITQQQAAARHQSLPRYRGFVRPSTA